MRYHNGACAVEDVCDLPTSLLGTRELLVAAETKCNVTLRLQAAMWRAAWSWASIAHLLPLSMV